MSKKHHAALIFARIYHSVLTRLLVLALCIVVSGAIVRYYVLTHFLREDLSSVVEGQQLALATYVAHDVDSKIVRRRLLIERLAASVPLDLLARPEQLRDWLKDRSPYQTLLSIDVFIVDASGKRVAGYPDQGAASETDYAGRDYIQAGLAGKSFVGQPIESGVNAEPVLPISAPVSNAEGKVQGVLVGMMSLSAPGFLDSLLQSRGGTSTGEFQLIFPQSRLQIESSPQGIGFKSISPPGLNVLQDRAMAGFRGTGITVGIDGKEEVRAMASVPSTGWFIVASLPGHEAFSTVERTQGFLIRGALSSIFLFGIICSIVLYFVFRPLFHAAAQADCMTRDELPHAPLPVVRNDEVGHLISAFNRLLFKLNEKRAELEKIAHHDTLTGLPNRHHLSGRLRQVLAQAQRKGTQVGLLFMDLDGFKRINDTLGHDAGDEVLRQVAKRFGAVVRLSDTLARIGGDEFVILLSDLGADSEETVSTVATKCIAALSTPFLIAGTVCRVGVSIGIALGSGESSADALLLTADRVMYQAKKTGRGRYMTHRL
ncbi:diguanylate cyclase [Pseudomonas gingeri]|uniref:sensor domain-containing diguanylate cyclase n=1 Tax=Pseudomonas gingeri TaxID=117681 RepID=UPI0015A2453E|nr:sensor domain-containing diguanylate cyclase [Pseudomonas gingeri]NWA23287.1 diguanylate cyclase [Pseudomonas gingeri]NWD76953.1 diguanylate cyclase [Pseudomonas gingeri]